MDIFKAKSHFNSTSPKKCLVHGLPMDKIVCVSLYIVFKQKWDHIIPIDFQTEAMVL